MDGSAERDKFSGKPLTPEKSSFAQTCSLLSQYRKEKRNYEENGVERADLAAARPWPPATMNLLTNMVSNGASTSSNITSGHFLKRKKSNKMSSELKQSQMTIFYDGYVHVFNDLSVHKAKEIVALATDVYKTSTSSTAALDMPNASGGGWTALLHRRHQPPFEASELPQSASSSLHRFFAKRNDRTAVKEREPHQLEPVQWPLASAGVDHQENKTRRTLEPETESSSKITPDLNL